MAKQIKQGEDARKALCAGIDTLANTFTAYSIYTAGSVEYFFVIN